MLLRPVSNKPQVGARLPRSRFSGRSQAAMTAAARHSATVSYLQGCQRFRESQCRAGLCCNKQSAADRQRDYAPVPPGMAKRAHHRQLSGLSALICIERSVHLMPCWRDGLCCACEASDPVAGSRPWLVARYKLSGTNCNLLPFIACVHCCAQKLEHCRLFCCTPDCQKQAGGSRGFQHCSRCPTLSEGYPVSLYSTDN